MSRFRDLCNLSMQTVVGEENGTDLFQKVSREKQVMDEMAPPPHDSISSPSNDGGRKLSTSS